MTDEERIKSILSEIEHDYIGYDNLHGDHEHGMRLIEKVLKAYISNVDAGEMREQGMSRYNEVLYEPVENIYGKAYKRTCPFCGDVIVISSTAIEFENYCRMCGKRLRPEKENKE